MDPTNEKKQLPRAGPASFYGITSVMYNMEEGDTTVFTPKNIKGMCETERLWMDVPAFQDYWWLAQIDTEAEAAAIFEARGHTCASYVSSGSVGK